MTRPQETPDFLLVRNQTNNSVPKYIWLESVLLQSLRNCVSRATYNRWLPKTRKAYHAGESVEIAVRTLMSVKDAMSEPKFVVSDTSGMRESWKMERNW